MAAKGYTSAVPDRGPGGFWARFRGFRSTYQAPHGLFWIKRVNHTAGALIAFLLVRTPVTANGVTVSALAFHLVGAALVASAAVPADAWLVVSVIVIWQLAFSLDCADGSLARARGTASPFGAWLDQTLDSVSRTAVYTALVVFVVRALQLDAVTAVVLAAASVALALLQTFSSWQRAAVIGGGSPAATGRPVGDAVLSLARHLVDYGAFLFVASVLLLVPRALLVLIVFVAAVNALFVATQVALAWRRHARTAGESA